MGYHLAGWDVVGVDIQRQSRYPFDFIQADALDVVESWILGGAWAYDLRWRIDAIHASPPCQLHSPLRARHPGADYPDLVARTRQLLAASGLPYIIENVPGAPLDHPVLLCGSMFGLGVRRHRLFECSFPLLVPPCTHGYQQARRYRVQEHGVVISSPVARVYGDGGGKAKADWPAAMGISWMTSAELTQAIPPAYTQLIGETLLGQL